MTNNNFICLFIYFQMRQTHNPNLYLNILRIENDSGDSLQTGESEYPRLLVEPTLRLIKGFPFPCDVSTVYLLS